MRTLARSIWSKLARSVRPEDTTRPEARTLSDLAGTANAIVRTKEVRTRRGTFLVLVVGTLALLSVIAIVYVTIGTQDTRVQTAAVRKEKVEDVPQRVGDYLANIIAQDRLATTYDDASILGPDGLPVMMREISDYPSTDPQVRSDLNDPSGIADLRHASWRFDPAGRIDVQSWFNSSEIRTAVPPSDPWLAVSEPTWIGIDSDNPDQLAAPTDVTRLYRDMKDWGHISNFAPNGRFVNLANLRNNFNAAPGTGANQMSYLLSLYDANGEATNQTFYGEVADPNVPSLWDSHQRGAARPAAFVPYDPVAQLAAEDPSTFVFKLYQWADADGDGVLDSRWFELVDDRNGLANLLGDTGRYRYFVAARAVDLSARVNVNVATDFRSAVRIDGPAGITPGDVDLRRLLALTDSYDFNAPIAGGEFLGGGYDNFRNPTGQALAESYGPGGGGDQLAYPAANMAPGYARNRALQVAEFAYASLRLSMASGMPLGPTTLDGSIKLQGPDLLTTIPGDLSVPADRWDTAHLALGAERRRTMYQRVVTGGDGDYADANGWRSTVRFSMPDLAELLTRNTVNDPDTLSSLELVLGGRDNTANAPGVGSARYSPLRDNRGLKLELSAIPDEAYDVTNAFDGNGDTTNQINDGLEAFEARYLAQMQTDIRQRLTTLSGAVPLRPVRGVHPWTMTASELPTDIGAIIDPNYDIADSLMQMAQGTQPNEIVPTPSIDSVEAKMIFRAYADQLLPFSGVTLNGRNAWDLGSRDPGELQTMFYGYRGPEVALYAAAHMTANFIDMADSERMTKNNNDNTPPIDATTFDDDYELNIPSVYTLIVRPDLADSSVLTRLGPSPIPPEDVYVADRFTVASETDIRELNLDNLTGGERLAMGNGAATVTPQNQAGVNIFGIEAQPFLSRVSVFTTYIDRGTPDDQDVEIDGSIRETNPDFAFRVVAWQLTNPFNVPIVLWDNSLEGNSANQAEQPRSRYYVEMDGRTYLIRPLTDNGGVTGEAAVAPAFPQSDRNIIIYPQRTIVVYALSQPPATIATRIGSGFTTAQVYEAVESTFGEHSTNDPGDVPLANPALYSPDTSEFQGFYYVGAVDSAAADPRAATVPAAATFSPLITTDRPESRLWRRVLAWSRPDLAGTVDLVEFDQLLDRLRVPEGDGNLANATDPDVYPVLNRRLGNPASDTSSSVVTIPDSGDDGSGTSPDFADPVLTLWASVRRPANPGEPAMGALPAYCLEPKGSSRWNVFNNDRLDIFTGNWNPIGSSMPRTSATLEVNDFRASPSDGNLNDGNSAYQKFADWRTSVTSAGFVYRPQEDASAAPVNADDAPAMLGVVPNLWGTTGVNPDLRTLVGNSEYRPAATGPAPSDSDARRFNPLLPQTRYYNQWYPQVIINNSYFAAPNAPANTDPAKYTRSVRVADMLLPLAVGPMMNPAFESNDDPVPTGDQHALTGRDWTNMDLRWTTLSEAMAIALGYQPTLTNNNADTLSEFDIATLSNPYSFELSPARANYINRPLFDRGQLRLDEFVLFRDLSSSPARLGVFDYASDGAADVRLFTEAPAALGILDSFTVAPVGVSRAGGGFQELFAGATGLPAERDAAELTRPIPGLININTASPTVLRTIPGLAPWEDANQRNEIQRVTIGSAATPAVGDFSLQIGNPPASTIEVSAASAGVLQAYIEGLDEIDPGDVRVTMITMNPPTFDVEFIGSLAGTGFSAAGFGPMAVPNAPTSGTVTVTQVQAGNDPLIGPIWANGTLLGREVDLAAVITATRDKSRQFLRPQSSVAETSVTNAGLVPGAVSANFDPSASAGFVVEQLSFFDREPGATGAVFGRDVIWPTGFDTNDVQTWLDDREGRRAATEIRGISEREGFRTVGSVQAMASIRDGNETTNRLTGLDAAGALVDFGALPISIDFMGYKTNAVVAGVLDSSNNDMFYGANLRAHANTSQPGLTSGLLQTLWVASGDRANRDRMTTDAVPGDYAEKLTPMAAMSNIATTRSDYYAVWFVLHGYTEEDVTGLAATDPLAPSVARRFLMIVDRSNVTGQNQRPQVVLFREVPYTP